MIDLSEEHLSEVRCILAGNVPDCRVLAFGSRVRGTARRNSDLDLMLLGRAHLDWRLIEQVKDSFSDSYLPFLVDVVDGNSIEDTLRGELLRDSVVIQEPAP